MNSYRGPDIGSGALNPLSPPKALGYTLRMKFREFPNHDAIALSAFDFPWHTRVHTHDQERRYRKLIALHDITLEWIEVLKLTPPGDLIREDLDEPLSPHFEALLDDTSPEDVLIRLEEKIWKLQAHTLQAILKMNSYDPLESLVPQLEQASWRLGRRASEANSQALPEHLRHDLRSLVLTALESPFFPQGTEGFLIKRAVRDEIQLELHCCPHQKPWAEILQVADPLCTIHSQWLRGYAYGLNPRVALETTTKKNTAQKRCCHRWHLIHNLQI